MVDKSELLVISGNERASEQARPVIELRQEQTLAERCRWHLSVTGCGWLSGLAEGQGTYLGHY